MLPLQQSYELKYALTEYLKATFQMNREEVNDAFQAFLLGKNGMFKGPYLSARLPFKQGGDEEIPLEIKPPFPPYKHQTEAFERLSSHTEVGPQPTLITTGTASGKTECFMYPVLDYCFSEQHRPGIKVIILYPMNALATDQAKRLAEAIYGDERLRGVVTAGLFIGEGKDASKYPTEMGCDHIIENRSAIVSNPPDILLTNFKMLDYGLMRHTFHDLWTYNLKDSALLKFIVLDELHTYDGAQGTDVANLIRRLKLKLEIEKGTIIPVGTSATIGSGEDSKRLLALYASKVFGEDFSEASIIEESRLEVEEYFASEREMYDFLPSLARLQDGRMGPDETYASYIDRQKVLWRLQHCTTAVALGDELKQLQIVRQIVEVMSEKPVDLAVAMKRLCDRNERYRELPEQEGEGHEVFCPREEILNSIWALMSEARRGDQKLFPFVYLQAQLWIRELSGVLREIGTIPKFVWRDDVDFDGETPLALPPYFCRECGASGWLAVKQDNNDKNFEKDASIVYERFFQYDKNVYMLNPKGWECGDEYKATDWISKSVDPNTLFFASNEDKDAVQLVGVRKLDTNQRLEVCCPECNGTQLAIVGTKIPTLSSIGVSQLLASDLDPRSDKERKTLAFTNSVQDAAHQAGFIEARNYRFTMRTSMQQVINQVEADSISLADLQGVFKTYWLNKSKEDYNSEMPYYHRFFPTDVKASIVDYQTKKGLSERFKKEFQLRVDWEIISEFGLNATIGRTLEKTGTSACGFDAKQIEHIAEVMRPWLESNQLPFVTHEELCCLINLLLHRIRMRGGIAHPYLDKARMGKLERWDLNWNKDKRHFMNRYFGAKARLPKFIGTERSNALLDSVKTPGTNKTWFKAYFLKSFPMATDYNAIINDFYRELLLQMEYFLDDCNSGDLINHALKPDRIQVGKQVAVYQCSDCAARLTTLESDKWIDGGACLSYRCTGKMKRTDVVDLTYYKLVYNRSRAPRIYATEHTGLLERKNREEKEYDFKNRPKDDSLNVLVATSTLEMGIDIGTLNSVMNNSVPPLTSNYLQRVGRAGRSSGAALVINFAKAQSHDQYYFAEPLEMMCGSVHTPGCFLEAKDILFRHFFAFCIDSWTKESPAEHVIIPQIRNLGMLMKDLDDPSLIYNRWIVYIQEHREQLLSDFIGLYKRELGEVVVLTELREEIESGNFFSNLRLAFQRLKQEYESLQEKMKQIIDLMKEKDLPETSDEYKELVRERKTLGGLRRLLDKRLLLEYLTNCGLLPNYAFPETGITLRSIVKDDKRAEGIENEVVHDLEFEIVRGAQQGIKELAPGNDFYTQGFKMQISGIDTSDWKDEGVLQRLRFCSVCDALLPDLPPIAQKCPKCGDESWGAASNVHAMIRLNAVKSINRKYDARIMDGSEDRESKVYRMSRHLEFDATAFAGAMMMRDLHFGIEYVKRVKMTELNLGQRSVNGSSSVQINGQDKVPVHGFVTCKHCGKSTDEVNITDVKQFHYGYCKYKNEGYKGKTDDIFEELFLLRSMQTEGLKILLPTQDFDSQSVIDMFREGLILGLKKYYNGHPDHLELCDYREYNQQTGKMDTYLVMMDRIPGGTGYLRKLYDRDEFAKLLMLAYAEIRDCPCQHTGKDGCYRCIYTYGNQYNRADLSRSRAEVLFKKLTERANDWELLDHSLSKLGANLHLEESELEERFVKLLRAFVKNKREEGWEWTDLIDNGRVLYHLKIKSGVQTWIYQVIPQYQFRSIDGVKYTTIPDFYFKPIKCVDETLAIDEQREIDGCKGIAVYLDGYAYHASQSCMRFYDDVQKRCAVYESDQHLSWTLTWDDLDIFENQEMKDMLCIDKKRNRQTIEQLKRLENGEGWITQNKLIEGWEGRCNVSRLLFLLSIGDNYALWHSSCFGVGLASIKALTGNCFATLHLEEYIRKSDLISSKNPMDKSMGDDLWFVSDISACWHFGFLNLVCQHKYKGLKAYALLNNFAEDLPRTEWQNFWLVYNLYQNVICCERELKEPGKEPEEFEELDKLACLTYFDEEYHDIVRKLIEYDIPFNEEGSFFVDGIDAEAVFGWEDRKLFIGGPLDDRVIFKNAGYTELDPVSFDIEMFI